MNLRGYLTEAHEQGCCNTALCPCAQQRDCCVWRIRMLARVGAPCVCRAAYKVARRLAQLSGVGQSACVSIPTVHVSYVS